MKLLYLLLFMPFISTAQIVKVKTYNLKPSGLLWKAEVELVEENNSKEAFLKIQYRDNGIYLINYTYLTFEEVKAINSNYMDLAKQALNDEKSDEELSVFLKTGDDTYIGYTNLSSRINWFLYKESLGIDSKIGLERDKLFSIFREAEKKMTELLN